MKKLIFDIPEEMSQRLQIIVDRTNVKKAQLARIAIDKYLEVELHGKQQTT